MQGKVSEEKVDCFNLPIYFMCPKELETAVERNGCFRIERMETLPRQEMVNGNASSAIQLAAHLRASTEGLIQQQFGDEDMIEELFDLYAKKLEHILFPSSVDSDAKGGQLCVVLKRNFTKA